MEKFEVVVSRRYSKRFTYQVEAATLGEAEMMDYELHGTLTSEGGLNSDEDEVIDVRPMNPHPVEAYELASDTGGQ